MVEKMPWWFYLIIGVLVITATIFFYFYPNYFYPTLAVQVLGPFPLMTPTKVFGNDIPVRFATTSACTLQAFFYPLSLQRTPTAVACNTPGNPSCDDGRFHTCDCGQDIHCTKCTRNGYTPLFSIADVLTFEILAAPDAGRQGKAMTQLAIRTQTNMDASGNTLDVSGNSAKANTYTEFIVLPPLDLQKWTMISLVREGRRFDVYYNNKLVTSQKTMFPLATIATQGPVLVGNPGFGGYSGAYNYIDSAMDGSSVAAAYAKQTDTRGAPYLQIPETVKNTVQPTSKTIGSSFNFPGLEGVGFKYPSMPSFCLSGSCSSTPKVQPAKPWLEWDTAYA
jgi:hypothetical protein